MPPKPRATFADLPTPLIEAHISSRMGQRTAASFSAVERRTRDATKSQLERLAMPVATRLHSADYLVLHILEFDGFGAATKALLTREIDMVRESTVPWMQPAPAFLPGRRRNEYETIVGTKYETAAAYEAAIRDNANNLLYFRSPAMSLAEAFNRVLRVLKEIGDEEILDSVDVTGIRHYRFPRLVTSVYVFNVTT